MQKRIIQEELLVKYQRNHIFDEIPSIEEWLTYWLKHYIEPNCKPNTYSNFYSYIHSHILPMIGDYLLDEASTMVFQYYVDHKLACGRRDGKGGLSIKTVKEHISLLNSAFKKAISLNVVKYNPIQSIVFPKTEEKEIQVFDLEEQKTIEQHINPRYQANSNVAILLGMNAGLRIGEISALRIEDIDLTKRVICVDESLNRIAHFDESGAVKYKLLYGSTKSSKIRYVPMSESIYVALTQYFDSMPAIKKQEKKAPLFFNRNEVAMEPRVITYHFQKLCKELGIEGYHFHCLRHTFATRALESNIDIKSCSKMLGHASTQITLDRYTHISYHHLQKEIRKLNHNTSA